MTTQDAWNWLDDHAKNPEVQKDLGEMIVDFIRNDPSDAEQIGKWVIEAFMGPHIDPLDAVSTMLSAVTGWDMADYVQAMKEDYD